MSCMTRGATRSIPVWMVLSSLWLCSQPTDKSGGRPALTANRPSSPVQLDGRMDEPAWRDANPAVELVQQSPNAGGATPYRTQVRVLIVDNNLYIGFQCTDPDPKAIAVHSMLRDGTSEGDDTVSVVLDTYGDHRTGYLFRVNQAGARTDGLIAGPEQSNLDWDGIWDARTARTADGWTAEIVIPADTLSFTQGLTEWGVNFERNIARDHTVLRWTSPTLDSFFFDLSRAGSLAGIGQLRQGRGIEVSPFTVGRLQTDFRQPNQAWQGELGAYVTWRITPQLAAVFTVNTDFAETEVDSRQLNLTRFPLLFPKKRSFFLEGANQFEFGAALEDQFIPFFSRNIGLFQGEQIPIDAGFKINGRVAIWNIGMLDVETRDIFAASVGSVVPRTNLFAGRISYDVNDKLRLGGLLTNGNPDGIHSNTLAGFDGVWRTSKFRGNKNLRLAAWAAFSAGAGNVSGGSISNGNRTGWAI